AEEGGLGAGGREAQPQDAQGGGEEPAGAEHGRVALSAFGRGGSGCRSCRGPASPPSPPPLGGGGGGRPGARYFLGFFRCSKVARTSFFRPSSRSLRWPNSARESATRGSLAPSSARAARAEPATARSLRVTRPSRAVTTRWLES